MSFWRTSLSAIVVVVVALALFLPLQPPAAQALPAGLPTHFALGIGAQPDDTWMAQTGIPWDYRFQYLAGGVNTGVGWETWNTNGTYALNYANASAQHGWIPMFPYYELFQSDGTCNGCNENQRNITNLNTASTMQAYYANFALLMKRLGPGNYDGFQGFGKTALVNVEPDFAGGYAVQATNNGACFGFCTGVGNDPALLKASVASSGHPDVGAYPNTYVGFTRALAHLRDVYAPNVLLGFDISPWATGIDIGSDTNPSTNGAALGQQVGVFLSKTGPHELLFNDPLDRDAGQYKTVYGQNRWWDKQNVTLPNFARWEQYLHSAIVADGNKSLLLWQVPLGNQYFQTENNTDGHYQDNRAEYIFSHIPELIQNGIVGAMFMAGNAGNTTYNDAKGDGITNPPSFCTTDGTSSGQICNNHASTVSDDDGGYVRMSAKQYYTNPVPLTGGTPPTNTPTPGPATATPTATAVIASTATPTPTTTVGQATYSSRATTSPASVARGATLSITSSVTSSKASNALVDVEVYDPAGTRVFQQFWDNQAFTAGQTRTFPSTWQVPAGAALGTYSITIGVFSPGWGTVYNWNAAAGSFGVTATAVATSTPTLVPTNTPTARPTNTPTPLPVNTATPVATSTQAPVQRSYTTSASASPATATRGTSTVSIQASVKSATASSALIDVEVYNASGALVSQRVWDAQAFTAGQTRTFTTTWAVPLTASPGTYTIKVGVFSPGWGTLYSWNNQAGTFGVI
jgi:hypothetical protein